MITIEITNESPISSNFYVTNTMSVGSDLNFGNQVYYLDIGFNKFLISKETFEYITNKLKHSNETYFVVEKLK